jgi:Helix-turn-helix domain
MLIPVLHGEETVTRQEALEIQGTEAPQAVKNGGHAAIRNILDDDLAACENSVTRDQRPDSADVDQERAMILAVAGCLQQRNDCVANLCHRPVAKNVVGRRPAPAVVWRVDAEATRAIEADPALIMRCHAVRHFAPSMQRDARHELAQGGSATGMVGMGMRQKDMPQLGGVEAAGLDFRENGRYIPPGTGIEQGEPVAGVEEPHVAIEHICQRDAGGAARNEMDGFRDFHAFFYVLSSCRSRSSRRRFWVLIAAGVSPPVGARWFRKPGGMPPSMLTASSKPLSGRYLSFAEREELAIQHAQGAGVRQIAWHMGRSGSTISREVRRNAASRGGELDYRASTAQWHAERAARRPKPAKLAVNGTLRTYVQDRLAGMIVTPSGAGVPGPTVGWKGRRHGPRKDRRWASAWSPEQIAHRLRRDFPHDETMRISHEAIYQSLYVQGRGALRRELTACLRTGRALRMPRARSRGRGKSFIVPEIMISERPAEAADRAVPGHWEGDLILGLDSSASGP